MNNSSETNIKDSIKSYFNIILRFGFFIVMSFLSLANIYAALVTNKNTNGGNWGTNTTWTGNTAPTSADSVVITTATNKNVTLDVDRTIEAINITSGSTLIVNNTLTVTRSFINNGTITFGSSGQIIQTGIYPFTNNNGATITASSGTITTTGNFTNNGTFTAGTSTVTLNGTTSQLIGGTTNPTGFYNLTIGNAEGIKLAASFRANITNNLTINSGAFLDIEPGRFVNAQRIVNNAGSSGLLIRASSTAAGGTLVFNNIESEPVQGTVEMYTKAYRDINATPQYKWQFFGIPLRSLATANPTFYGSFVRRHNEAGIGTGVWVTLNNSSSLNPFDGYQITQANEKTITFTGTLENRDHSRELSYTSDATSPGQHILSNPYTAAIDIKQISFGDHLERTIYFYNTGSQADWNDNPGTGSAPGQYLSVPRDNAGSGGLPGSIPSMQGFLVGTLSPHTSATISIPYASVAVRNAEALRVKSTTNEQIVSLIKISGSRYQDRMWLFSQEGTSKAYDNGWDGRKVMGSAAFPQIFAAETSGNYQVNTVDNIDNTMIGFRAGEDTQYTIRFEHTNSDLKYQQITLTDLATLQTVDVTESGSEYTFVHDPAFTGARFRINATNIINPDDDEEPVVAEEPGKDFKVYYNSGNLVVNNPADDAGVVYLYDLKNQAVRVFNFGGNSINHFALNLPPGVYLAKAAAGKLKKNTNIIVR